MLDIEFLQFAIDCKREQIATATPVQLSRITAELNGLMVRLDEEIRRREVCGKGNSKAAMAAKPLLPRAVEDVLLALEIPLDKCQAQSLKSQDESPQNLASELLRKSNSMKSRNT